MIWQDPQPQMMTKTSSYKVYHSHSKWCQLWSSINPSRSKLVEEQSHGHISPDPIKYSSLDHETQQVHLF